MVLSSFAVGACLMPNDAPNTEEFRSLLASLRREDCRVLEAYRGITLTFGEIFLEVLSPGIYTPLGENAKSQALRLTYRGNSFLFMGDCGIPEEGEILSHYSASDLSSQVLKVGHHGSRDGTGEAFLSAVCPEIAVISCGSGNSYGFPGAELLVRLSAAGCRILRTDTGGTHALLGNGRDVTALK